MKKMKMNVLNRITFEQGCDAYISNCKARNLRNGTIKHYHDSIKQILKYINSDMYIETMNKNTFNNFCIDLRENDDLNDMSLYTYSRDLKTLRTAYE